MRHISPKYGNMNTSVLSNTFALLTLTPKPVGFFQLQLVFLLGVIIFKMVPRGQIGELHGETCIHVLRVTSTVHKLTHHATSAPLTCHVSTRKVGM